MRRVKVLFINVIILTATSLLMRTIGIFFQVYLSNKIGSAGIGLFQLILSVYYLAVTLATSGIRLAVIRLVAEELGLGRNFGAKRAVHNCLAYATLFSTAAAITLYLSSQFIAENWLCDARTLLSLRCLAFCLPFVAISSVFSGYFTAVRRAVKAASVQFVEQLVKISVTVACLSAFMHMGLEYLCLGMVIGMCIGEVSSFSLLFCLYHLDIRRYKTGNKVAQNLILRMLYIAVPIALSAYITSIIRTVQHLLVPFGLKQSGASSENALATYGTIHGMVIPVLMFPSVLLDTISDLIVPELAECQARGSIKRLNYIINRVFKLGMLTSICVMFIFLKFSNELGYAIFKSANASHFIKILAPIIPIMYLDTIVDGILKGIGEQISSMRYNIIDALVSVALIYVLLPKFAIAGYIFTVFFARILNFLLSIKRLTKVTGFKVSVSTLIKAFFCILASLTISSIFFHLIQVAFKINNPPLFFLISFVTILYFLLLRMLSCVTHDDLLWFKAIFK